MRRPFTFASRPGLFASVLLVGIVASLLWASPVGAVVTSSGGGGGCFASNTAQVAAATAVACGSTAADSTCAQETNGIKTCAVAKLGNGLEFFALLAAVAGILVSAILWALGSKGQNPGQELTGKRGILVCLAAAMVIGAYPTLSTFFTDISNKPSVDRAGINGAAVPQVAVTGGSN